MNRNTNYSKQKNGGWKNIPSIFTKCLFISISAKQIYTAISDYSFGKKTDCFPSQGTISLELGISERSIGKYINELRDCGLIKTTSHLSGALIYYFYDIPSVAIIQHSEIVWKVLRNDNVKELGIKRVQKSLGKYKNSSLYSEVNKSKCLSDYKNKIISFFENEFNVSIQSEDFSKDSDDRTNGIFGRSDSDE